MKTRKRKTPPQSEIVAVHLSRELAMEWKQFLVVEHMCGNSHPLSMKLGVALRKALGE